MSETKQYENIKLINNAFPGNHSRSSVPKAACGWLGPPACRVPEERTSALGTPPGRASNTRSANKDSARRLRREPGPAGVVRPPPHPVNLPVAQGRRRSKRLRQRPGRKGVAHPAQVPAFDDPAGPPVVGPHEQQAPGGGFGVTLPKGSSRGSRAKTSQASYTRRRSSAGREAWRRNASAGSSSAPPRAPKVGWKSVSLGGFMKEGITPSGSRFSRCGLRSSCGPGPRAPHRRRTCCR